MREMSSTSGRRHITVPCRGIHTIPEHGKDRYPCIDEFLNIRSCNLHARSVCYHCARMYTIYKWYPDFPC